MVISFFSLDKPVYDFKNVQDENLGSFLSAVHLESQGVKTLIDRLVQTNLLPIFLQYVLQSIPYEIDPLVIEGYALTIPEIKNPLYEKLQEKGFYIWETSRVHP